MKTLSIARDELAELTALPHHVVDQALSNLREQRCSFLVLSGLMGSGKDTIAPLAMERAGCVPAVHASFATALKDDINAMLVRTRELQSEDDVVTYLQAQQIASDVAVELTHKLLREAADPQANARSRTVGMRDLLQFYGTDCRRASSRNYWVGRGLNTILPLVADGKSVFVTDARFVNEVECSAAAGATVIRLHVTAEEQRNRLIARDGHLPAAQAFTHPSETDLSSYPFELEIATTGQSVDETVAAVVALMGT